MAITVTKESVTEYKGHKRVLLIKTVKDGSSTTWTLSMGKTPLYVFGPYVKWTYATGTLTVTVAAGTNEDRQDFEIVE